MAEGQRRNVTDLLCKFYREGHKVIFANGDELDGVGELVRLGTGVDVHGDELLRFLGANGCDRGEEIDEFVSVVALCVKKIQAIFCFPDVYCVFVSGVFEYELFEVEEGSFMRDFLTDLDDRTPGIGGEGFRTVGALVIIYHVLDFESLL